MSKYCIACGTELPDVARFCFKCGTQQPEVTTEDIASAKKSKMTDKTDDLKDKFFIFGKHRIRYSTIKEYGIGKDDVITSEPVVADVHLNLFMQLYSYSTSNCNMYIGIANDIEKKIKEAENVCQDIKNIAKQYLHSSAMSFNDGDNVKMRNAMYQLSKIIDEYNNKIPKKTLRYLYITTFQRKNFKLYEDQYNIDELLAHLDKALS